MHIRHAFLSSIATAQILANNAWNRGPVLFVRKQFAWEFVGRHGIWGYWQNRLTNHRTAKRITIEGTSRLHRSWLTGSNWDHDRYPIGASGFEDGQVLGVFSNEAS